MSIFILFLLVLDVNIFPNLTDQYFFKNFDQYCVNSKFSSVLFVIVFLIHGENEEFNWYKSHVEENIQMNCQKVMNILCIMPVLI